MLDFTTVTVLEMSHAIEAEHELEQKRRLWRGRLREIRRGERSALRRAAKDKREATVAAGPHWN